MDLVFDCHTCGGTLVAGEKERGVPGRCAHCGVQFNVPSETNGTRCSALLLNGEIVGMDSIDPARDVMRVLRRVRPAPPPGARPLIATSARVTPPVPRLNGVPFPA
jgi:DNA-directed RNA polymerase subunit RPC12/RpoP